MEALLVDTIPAGKEWRHELKWDGFRCLAFKDGKNVELQPKSGQSVGRYFPELIFALKEIKTKKFVLDGEIVIPVQGSFSFELCCREFTLLKAGSRPSQEFRHGTRFLRWRFDKSPEACSIDQVKPAFWH